MTPRGQYFIPLILSLFKQILKWYNYICYLIFGEGLILEVK